ncbi:F0F1 ATP synthase subunit A [Microbacterium sp. Marseille-Q6965]|uniref:F0F1 ATP synthase subunit A n=1 Tax=Microbacterium sp. Marseille-Q6965 TaxID=2965072 RepID=UPI0021B77546|nr:F0F1 ATP synthase subunit A [Microbacterium sp. Marseille-Q6965]
MADGNEFTPPSITDFFPDAILTIGGVDIMTRINLAQVLATIVLVIILVLGTRRLTVVPGRFQSVLEFGFGFVRNNIAYDLLGEKDGKRFVPLLTAMFFTILFMNVTGVVPGINLAGTSVIGAPLVFAIVAYVVFIYAGIKKHGAFHFLKASLLPGGVPIYLAPMIMVIEFISTFIVRPVSLTLRLLMNMMVGHFMLSLFFAATNFFILSGTWMSLFSVGSGVMGLAFMLFELFVAFLQAYVFTILTAVYIQLSLADEH